jgi:hypothetical protein
MLIKKNVVFGAPEAQTQTLIKTKQSKTTPGLQKPKDLKKHNHYRQNQLF